MYKYPVAQPDLNGNELRYVTEAVKSGWVSSSGPFVARFEEAFARWCGTEYAVACSSGVAGLTLALRALGIGPQDEVIVPEFTMIASAWAVTYTGAKPVFVDCADDLNIDVKNIEKKLTSRTKAIMPVHIYGRPCDMVAINKIAEKHNLFVVEDACEAHGASIGEQKVGTFGQIGVFSLFGNKIITAGEGGIAVCDDENLAREMRYLRAMSFENEHSFLHKKVGYNFRMTNLQAAVALAQIEGIELFLEKRKKIQEWYDLSLKDWTLPRPEGSVLWMYDVVVDADERKEIIQRLAINGIESRLFFKPMSMQPMYEGSYLGLNAYAFSTSGFYLPAYTHLTQLDVEMICQKFLNP